MQPFAKHEKEFLLKLARRTIERKVLGRPVEFETFQEEALIQAAGAFVSLHQGEELRGCIGRIRSRDPLYLLIQEVAIAAATQDPRFLPVRPEELKEILLEISVLSVPQLWEGLEKIEIGRHGLIVSSGALSGVLLPQVASAEGWDAETFLCNTCAKAGLPMDYWAYGKPKIEIFSAEVFSEKDLG